MKQLQDEVNLTRAGVVNKQTLVDQLAGEAREAQADLREKLGLIGQLQKENADILEQLRGCRADNEVLKARGEDLQLQLVVSQQQVVSKEESYAAEIRQVMVKEGHATKLLPQLQEQVLTLKAQLEAAEERALDAARLSGILQAKEQQFNRLVHVEEELYNKELELAKVNQKSTEQMVKVVPCLVSCRAPCSDVVWGLPCWHDPSWHLITRFLVQSTKWGRYGTRCTRCAVFWVVRLTLFP